MYLEKSNLSMLFFQTSITLVYRAKNWLRWIYFIHKNQLKFVNKKKTKKHQIHLHLHVYNNHIVYHSKNYFGDHRMQNTWVTFKAGPRNYILHELTS